MFKIPTYEELDKNDQEFSQKRKEYTSNLFQKRKLLNDELDEEKQTSKTTNIRKDEPITKKIKSPPPPPPPQTKTTSASLSAKNQPIVIDDDDDDLLLVDFISKNKDIIEKPSPSKTVQKNSSSSSDSSLFKLPNVPVQQQPATNKTTSLYLKKTIETNTVKTIAQQQQVTSSGTIVGGGSSGSGGPMIVNSKQRGNPVLKNIRNVQWNFSDSLTPDYCMTRSSCALYITMKYHLLNPTYIHQRIRGIY